MPEQATISDRQKFDALLVSYQGSRVVVRDDQGREYQCKLRQAARDSVTGDRVVVGVANGEPVVQSRHSRTSEFFRTDMRGQKKMIAANLNCLAIVIAPEPEAHLGLIDRYLVAAELSGLSARIVINKSDLVAQPVIDEVKRIYPKIGYDFVEVSAKQGDISSLSVWAADKKLAFLGQSGVGKSSLLNALIDKEVAEVGELSSKRAKGRHTTTSSYIYQMPSADGWVMDSPGIRDFENLSWTADEVLRGFPEIYRASLSCQFRNCGHNADRGCAVMESLELGDIEPSRLDNYRSILRSI